MEHHVPGVLEAVGWLKLFLELVGALVIGIGTVKALISLVKGGSPDTAVYATVRLDFAQYLSLALEFQLAADIVGTAFDPTWEQIGVLAAVATIRTALNFFLQREIHEEQIEVRELKEANDARTADSEQQTTT